MNSGLFISNWGRKLGKKLMKGPLKPKPEKGHVQKKWNIVKGDFVQVMEGPQTGQRGKILHVLRDTCRVIIEGVNLVRMSLLLIINDHYYHYIYTVLVTIIMIMTME